MNAVKRIRELEAWSKPGKVLSRSYGKDLAEELCLLGVSPVVFLGLNAIPDKVDLENLKRQIALKNLRRENYVEFSTMHGLEINTAESACQFLEYSLGRALAWIHLPEDDHDTLGEISALLHSRGHIVIDPESMEVVER